MDKKSQAEAVTNAQEVVKKKIKQRPGSNRYRDHLVRVKHALQWTEDTIAK